MDLTYICYLILVGLTVITMLHLARFAWLRREKSDAKIFALAMFAIAEAASMYLLLTITSDPSLAFVWVRLRFLGLAATPVLILMFILHYTNRAKWLSGRVVAALWIVPAVTQLVLWFGPVSGFFLHWNLVRVGQATMEQSQFAGWFWIHLLYSNVVLIGALAWLLYYAWRVDRSLMRGAVWAIAGISAGTLGALPGITVGTSPGFKFTPIGLGLTGAGLAIALFRYRLLDTRPIAYDAIFGAMRDAVIIIDEYNHVVQLNSAAERLLNQKQNDVAGLSIRSVFREEPELVEKYIGVLDDRVSLSVNRNGQPLFLDVRITPLYQHERFVGRIIVIHDITERNKANQALERAMAALSQTNEELRSEIAKREQAETRFQNLLEVAPDGILLTNSQGCITLVNAQAERLFGWERSELIGQPVEVLLDKATRDRHAQHRTDYYRDSRQRLMGVGMDLVAQRKDGSTFPCEISLSPLQTDDGTVVMSIVRDITTRNAAAAAVKHHNRALQALHDIASDIGAELNMDALLQHIVERAVRLLEADRGGGLYLYEPDGDHLRLVAGSGINQNRVGVTVKISEGVAGHVFQRGQPLIVNNYTAWAHHANILIADPPSAVLGVPLFVHEKVVGALLLVANSALNTFGERDLQLSQMFATYAGVALQNARLYDQARQEINQRKQAEQERERLIVELNAFAHTVAHDLKAPLAVIHGYYGLLDEELAEYPDETARDMIRAIGYSSWKMTKIIDELLIFASVRQLEDVKMVPLEMGKIIEEALSRLKFMIEQRQASVMLREIETWPTASGYVPWVEEVWTNYLSNALKYGGTPPHIELGATPEPGGLVRFWVRDNGAGLSAGQQAQLFQMYSRLDEMRIDGHGLGLSIVQRIINKLGGTVRVDSVKGEGSTFSFTLPGGAELANQPEHDETSVVQGT